jgi:hypothetical protein
LSFVSSSFEDASSAANIDNLPTLLSHNYMKTTLVRFELPDSVLEDFKSVAKSSKLKVSPVQPRDSTAEGFNAPITGQEFEHVMHLVTVAVTTGTAVLTFSKSLIAMLKSKGAEAKVQGKAKQPFKISGNTDPALLAEKIGSV